MKNNAKETIKDFKLIGERTKQRIIGLIEKRLTTQTIMLFAQEYESYDIEIRDEIIELITFLLNKEEEKLNDVKLSDKDSRVNMERKKIEFQEKQNNFRKIQDVLSKTESNKKQQKKVTLKIKETEPIIETKKVTKSVSNSKADNKLTQMLKEAELREQKLAKEEKQRQFELEKQKQLELEKQKQIQEKKSISKPKTVVKTEKVVKPKAEKATKPKATAKPKAETVGKAKPKKVLSYEEKLFVKQPTLKTAQERDYEKEQKEKELLWQELYGKSRNNSLNERQNNIAKEALKENIDKTPTIEEAKFIDFKLNGISCPIDEITNPKNKLYLFWSKIKTKYHVANLSIWLSEKNAKFQRKLYKKRMKNLSRFSKSTKPQSNTKSQSPNTKKEA